MAADATDLVRRVQPLLGGLLDRDSRERVSTQVLAPWLDRQIGARRLVLPVEAREWAVTLAERLAADVRRAGYPVRETSRCWRRSTPQVRTDRSRTTYSR